MQRTYSQQDILDYLEGHGPENYHFFIDLEHPYFFTAGSRLTLFADRSRWAIVFEKSGYSTGSSCGEIELMFFGNCLENLGSGIPGDTMTSNLQGVQLIGNEEFARIEADFEDVAPDKDTVKVRDTILKIEHDLSKYHQKGIQPGHDDNPENPLDFKSLIRYLDETHPVLFRATTDELRTCLPADIPQLMQIDQWHHRSYTHMSTMNEDRFFEHVPIGERPGSYETYPMMAAILVSADTTLWKPSLPPNNDWRNWPMAGYM